MVSLRSTLAAAVALVASVHAATDYYIDPTSVPLSTRKAWCTSETTQCPSICLDSDASSGKPIKNECDTATLTYSCVCGNNQSPNLTEYSLTLPYYKCVQYQENCVKACGGAANNDCSGKCRTDNPCGALSPKGANSSSTSSAGSAATSTTSSGPTLQTGFGSGDSSTQGSFATQAASLQASLTLATLITTILIGPLFLM